MFVKYFVEPEFDRYGFIELLREQMHVSCCAVSNGIILNLDEFNAWPAAKVPVWAWVNKSSINSRLHTRRANSTEVLLCSK